MNMTHQVSNHSDQDYNEHNYSKFFPYFDLDEAIELFVEESRCNHGCSDCSPQP